MKLNYSRMDTYRQCPLRYKYRYIDKMKEKPRPPLSLGSSVHKTLQMFYTSTKPIPTIEDLLSYLDICWVSDGYSSSSEEALNKSKAVKMLTDFYKRNIFHYLKAYKTEQYFEIHLNDIIINGYLDQVNKFGDTYEVVEYKTSQNGLSLEEASNDLQIITYHVAFKSVYGFPPESVVYHNIKSGKIFRIKVSYEQEEKTLNFYREISEGIKKEMFSPKINVFCRWCDFIGICPAQSRRNGL